MNELLRLIEKHRGNGLLLDTNLLVLLLVGRTNRRRILDCKRTQIYTIKEYELLENFVAEFRKVTTTPHLLTEVSNLEPLKGREKMVYQLLFKQWIEAAEEFYNESRTLTSEIGFDRLGLADTAIEVVARRGMLVLTDDLDLYVRLAQHGIDTINFNHVRAMI